MGFNWLYLNPVHYPGFLPRCECAGDNDIDIQRDKFQRDKFGRQIRQPFEPPVGP
jgi:hypothetical protein